MTAAPKRRNLMPLSMGFSLMLPNGKAKDGEMNHLLVHSTSLLLWLVE